MASEKKTNHFQGEREQLPVTGKSPSEKQVLSVSSGTVNADPVQQRAICHGQGPCAVIAGPGSGKTFVLAERVRRLIDSGMADPSTILVMTFSRAAAQEMRNRFLSLELQCSPGVNGGDVIFGTFHSVFYRILQESSGERLRIVRQDEKHKYLRHLCEIRPDFSGTDRKDHFLTYGSGSGRESFCLPEKTTVEELQLLISRYKNGLPCLQPWLPALVRDYDRYLRSRGCLDFDDMILRCRDLLGSRPDIRSRWSSRFSWILVDEFQDVSPSQYEALLLLSAPDNNLFIVGDDDQSIYGFRGADPLMMKRFLQDFHLNEDRDVPGRIYLTTNYRCGRSILQAGDVLIRENGNRIKKAFRAGSKDPGLFYCRPFTDREAQYSFIAEELLSLSPEQLERTGIIFRTHAAAAKILPLLLEKKIPYTAEGRTRIPDHPTEKTSMLRDITAYYHAAAAMQENGIEKRDLLRIMNRPERFLSGSFIPFDHSDRESLLKGSGYERQTISELLNDLETLNILSPPFSFRYLLDSIGYRTFAGEAFPGKTALLDELTQESRRYKNSASWVSYLENLLTGQEHPRKEKPRKEKPRDETYRTPPEEKASAGGKVHILTMHACKGLEFDTVYIPDLNEGTIPAKQAWTRDQIEEERRLLYVAMTRAKHALTITYLEGNPDRPAAPSRFLRPLLKQLPKVVHPS